MVDATREVKLSAERVGLAGTLHKFEAQHALQCWHPCCQRTVHMGQRPLGVRWLCFAARCRCSENMQRACHATAAKAKCAANDARVLLRMPRDVSSGQASAGARRHSQPGTSDGAAECRRANRATREMWSLGRSREGRPCCRDAGCGAASTASARKLHCAPCTATACAPAA